MCTFYPAYAQRVPWVTFCDDWLQWTSVPLACLSRPPLLFVKTLLDVAVFLRCGRWTLGSILPKILFLLQFVLGTLEATEDDAGGCECSPFGDHGCCSGWWTLIVFDLFLCFLGSLCGFLISESCFSFLTKTLVLFEQPLGLKLPDLKVPGPWRSFVL